LGSASLTVFWAEITGRRAKKMIETAAFWAWRIVSPESNPNFIT
jgi:hypothetical protein